MTLSLSKEGLYTRTVRFFLHHSLHCKFSGQNLFPKIVVISLFIEVIDSVDMKRKKQKDQTICKTHRISRSCSICDIAL